MKKGLKHTAASLLVLSVAAGGGSSVFALEGQPAPAPGQAAITAIPAQSASQTIYHDYMKLLAAGKLAQAVAFLNNHIAKVDSWTGSMMALRLENAQNTAIGRLQTRFESVKTQKELDNAWRKGGSGTYTSLLKYTKDATTRKLLTDSRDQGFAVTTAEGMYFPVINYPQYQNWKANVGADIKLYIDMMAAQTRKPALKDAALVIPWSELLQRNLDQEKFIRSYGSSNRINQVKQQYEMTKIVVFYGSNNTPLFDYEAKKINPEALAAYKKVVAAGDTSSSPLLMKVSNFLKVVDRNGGKLTDDMKKWLANQAPMGNVSG
ncbi:hypothetical protein M3223_20660 [Paenibacillus pasadenensis]|uniref:hypothetical protein n=1 Tax=Paenibacillus pasadenensis TaxID=217090 RepID=UPI00203C9274|nr:hypothetical protein [Paenibacillus pasadenensis]MCM3749751.1 hypothetical protein [Paenibacillus pasadenensis]